MAEIWWRDEGWRTTSSFQAQHHRTQIMGAHFNFIRFYSSSPENKENILLEKPSRRKLRQQHEHMTSTCLWKAVFYQWRINTLLSQWKNFWDLFSRSSISSWCEFSGWSQIHNTFSWVNKNYTEFTGLMILILSQVLIWELEKSFFQ